jgi:hypothetical protein
MGGNMATVQKEAKQIRLEISPRNVPMLEALATPGRASSKDADTWMKNGNNLPATWTTAIAYVEPDTPIGKEIKIGDLTGVVPKELQGMINTAFGYDVVKHEDGTYTIENVRVLTENFPKKNGNYHTDKNGIPQGEEVSADDPDACYLSRLPKYAGAVVRGTYLIRVMKDVNATYGPNELCRVATLSEAQAEAEAKQAEVPAPVDKEKLPRHVNAVDESVQALKNFLHTGN